MKKKIIFTILLYILNITYTWAASKIFINNTSVDDVKSKLIDSFLSSDDKKRRQKWLESFLSNFK